MVSFYVLQEGNSASSKTEKKAQSNATKDNLKSEVKNGLHSKENTFTAQEDPNDYETPCKSVIMNSLDSFDNCKEFSLVPFEEYEENM